MAKRVTKLDVSEIKRKLAAGDRAGSLAAAADLAKTVQAKRETKPVSESYLRRAAYWARKDFLRRQRREQYKTPLACDMFSPRHSGDGDETEVDGFTALADNPYREHPYYDEGIIRDPKDYAPGGEFEGVEPPVAPKMIGSVVRKALAVDRSKLPGGITGKDAKLFVQQSLGYTLEEMAEASGDTVDAIKGRLKRARKSLKTKG